MTTIEAPKTTPKEVTTADVLERAIDLLGEFGWTKGTKGMERRRGPYCLLGSVFYAHLDLGLDIQAPWDDGSDWRQAIGQRNCDYELAASYLGQNDKRLYGWNDEPGRTESEVVSLLRQAAERSRETA